MKTKMEVNNKHNFRKKIYNWFLEIFRKKEYFEIDFNTLNNYSIVFREITENDLLKIKEVILKINDAEVIDDFKAELFSDKAIVFSNIDDLLNQIKNTVSEDFKDTFFEATSNNWTFSYFLTDSAKIYKDVIFVSNKLSYPEHVKKGDVIYSLLAIKKQKGNYFFWLLLE